MDEAEARAWLEAAAQTSEDPALSMTEVTRILRSARRTDANGTPPNADPIEWGNVVWLPTWDLNFAAKMAWRAKAGKAAANFDLTLGTKGLSRSQVMKQCLEMAREYGKLVQHNVSLGVAEDDALIPRAN